MKNKFIFSLGAVILLSAGALTITLGTLIGLQFKGDAVVTNSNTMTPDPTGTPPGPTTPTPASPVPTDHSELQLSNAVKVEQPFSESNLLKFSVGNQEVGLLSKEVKDAYVANPANVISIDKEYESAGNVKVPITMFFNIRRVSGVEFYYTLAHVSYDNDNGNLVLNDQVTSYTDTTVVKLPSRNALAFNRSKLTENNPQVDVDVSLLRASEPTTTRRIFTSYSNFGTDYRVTVDLKKNGAIQNSILTDFKYSPQGLQEKDSSAILLLTLNRPSTNYNWAQYTVDVFFENAKPTEVDTMKVLSESAGSRSRLNHLLVIAGGDNAVGHIKHTGGSPRGANINKNSFWSNKVYAIDRNNSRIDMELQNDFHPEEITPNTEDPPSSKVFSIGAKFADWLANFETKESVYAIGAGYKNGSFRTSVDRPNNVDILPFSSTYELDTLRTRLQSTSISDTYGNMRKIIYWHHGEDDARVNTGTQDYKDSLSIYISGMRDLMNDQTAELVVGDFTAGSRSADGPLANTNVRTALTEVRTYLPYSTFVNSDNLLGSPLGGTSDKYSTPRLYYYSERLVQNINSIDDTVWSQNPLKIKTTGEHLVFKQTAGTTNPFTTGSSSEKWHTLKRTGNTTDNVYSILADVHKYRNSDGYKFKLVGTKGDGTKFELVFKQNIHPMAAKDTWTDIGYEAISYTDTTSTFGSLADFAFSGLRVRTGQNNAILSGSPSTAATSYFNIGEFLTTTSNSLNLGIDVDGNTVTGTTLELFAVVD